MINWPMMESILSELENPNLFSEEREALQVMAALLTEKWEKENDEMVAEAQAA
ncbi:MAG: hypothetical protein ABIR24_15180 [Verrucomicrobiota bacterium]